MADKKTNKGLGVIIILLSVMTMMFISIMLLLFTFGWMKKYTLHGQFISVPDVSGMYEEEAGQALAAVGLKYEVLDYKYDKQMVEGGVIEQKPKPGAHVKDGRKIYLTLNSGKEPMRAVPDVADNSSLRQASSQLRAAGFVLTPNDTIRGEIDWVYKVLYNGKEMHGGDLVPEGASITLVVGNGEKEKEKKPEPVVDDDWF